MSEPEKARRTWRRRVLPELVISALATLFLIELSLRFLLCRMRRSIASDSYSREAGVRRHYSPQGNAVVFEGIRRGIAGDFDGGAR